MLSSLTIEPVNHCWLFLDLLLHQLSVLWIIVQCRYYYQKPITCTVPVCGNQSSQITSLSLHCASQQPRHFFHFSTILPLSFSLLHHSCLSPSHSLSSITLAYLPSHSLSAITPTHPTLSPLSTLFRSPSIYWHCGARKLASPSCICSSLNASISCTFLASISWVSSLGWISLIM